MFDLHSVSPEAASTEHPGVANKWQLRDWDRKWFLQPGGVTCLQKWRKEPDLQYITINITIVCYLAVKKKKEQPKQTKTCLLIF